MTQRLEPALTVVVGRKAPILVSDFESPVVDIRNPAELIQ